MLLPSELLLYDILSTQYLIFVASIFKMEIKYVLLFFVSYISITICMTERILFDFNSNGDISQWHEQSDTVRSVGMSKADLTIQKTQIFQRAIFFSLLNPQLNGACFAGIRTNVSYDLSEYKTIALNARGQGQNFGYKIVLRHKGWNDEPHPTYEQLFKAPTGDFDIIPLRLKAFKPYYRGKLLNDSIPLDVSNITSFGIQIYGGVYMPEKQHGVSSLEINWICAFG